MHLHHKTLLGLLSYNKGTGLFRWRVSSKHGEHKRGDVAGCFTANGYVCIRIHPKLYTAHRLALFYVNKVWPKVTDHVNGLRGDNRYKNLRNTSHSANSLNRHKCINPTGLLGITYDRWVKKWHAQLVVNGKHYSLRYHKTPELAHAAYRAAKRRVLRGLPLRPNHH